MLYQHPIAPLLQIATSLACPLNHVGLLFGNAQTSAFSIVPELSISLLVLSKNDLVSLANWTNREETVHGLQWKTLGLGNEEPDEDDASNHHGCEEEEDTTSVGSHGQEHLRSESRDDKVPKPVVGSSRCLSQASGVHIEHLRVEDPWCAVPRWSVEGSPKVEEEHGGDTTRAQVGTCTRGGSLNCGGRDVSSQNPHADGATEGTSHEQVPATKVVDHEKHPKEGEDSFNDTENSSGQEPSVSALNTNCLKNRRTVVVDGVDTRSVLPHEEETTEQESPLNLAVTTDSLERLPEALSNGCSLLFEGGIKHSDFLDDVDVLNGEVTDVAKVLQSL